MLFPRRGNRQICCLWGGPEKSSGAAPPCAQEGPGHRPAAPRWSFPFFPPLPPTPRLTDTVAVAFMPKLSPSLCVLDPWVFQSGQFAITSFRTPSGDARVEVSPALCSDSSSGLVLFNLDCHCFCFGFPVRLAIPKGTKHLPARLLWFSWASHLSLSIWSV